MRFNKLKLKNIRSYKSLELEFPEGSILLSGDVGSGKTSILLAVEYALFGVQPGQKGTSLLRNDAKIGEVTLELDVAGKNIIIERKLKRSSKGVSNEFAAITINGERSESSITEIKSKVVVLLGYPPEFVKKNNMLYRYTVYTPQEQMKQIILEDTETRMNILRHVFGIDKYKRISENLYIVISTLKNDIKFLQIEIRNLDEEKIFLESKRSQVKILKQKIEEKENELKEKSNLRITIESTLQEIEDKIQERRIFEQEVEKAKIMLTNKREIVSSLSREIDELKNSLQQSRDVFNEEEYSKILSNIISHKELVESYSSKLLESSSKIAALEKNQKEQESKKERVFTLHVCPTCLQDVSEVHKHNILIEAEARIADITKQLFTLNNQLREYKQEIEGIKRELVKQEDKKVQLEIIRVRNEYVGRSRTKLEELEKQKQTFENDLIILIDHIEVLKKEILKFSAFENLYKRRQNEIKEALSLEKNTEIALAELKKEVQLTEHEISVLNDAIQKKEMLKVKMRELTELIDWLSSPFSNLVDFTERNVLLRLRNEFSQLFRKWFLMLIPENSLDCHLDENFTPIITQGETEMDYEFLSGGERTAVALAYRLALNQTVNSLLSKIRTRGIVILDEPTDGFSEIQINKMRDILEELNATQLVIVSHEPKIEGFVDNVMRVAKENDFSVIDAISLSTA